MTQQLSKFFTRKEFKCKCGRCPFQAVDAVLLRLLEDVRQHFDKPLIITSGIRCASYNKKIGGAFASYHVKGLAADFYVKDASLLDVYNYLINQFPSNCGIGLYDSWIHLDVREEPARWDLRTRK